MSVEFRKVCGSPCNHITAELALFIFGNESLYIDKNIDKDYVKNRVKEIKPAKSVDSCTLLSPYDEEFYD